MDIAKIREQLFNQDETEGYIERETALDEFLKQENLPEDQGDRYVAAMEYVLPRLSSPISEDDLILGSMKLGPIPYEMEGVAGGGHSHIGNPFAVSKSRIAGHMSMDYEDLLKKGLNRIVEEMETRAETEIQKHYASLSRRAVEAIRIYQLNYARAAEEKGLTRQAEALKKVPYEPAYDFFSALQSVWFFEMILLCVVGGRDFAYSRLDLALLPYFKEAEEADAREIILSFLIKNNEVGGFSSDVEWKMPVPCCATNIYLMLGGYGAEEALPLSLMFMKAAMEVHLPQPVLACRMTEKDPEEWKLVCMEATMKLSGQVSFYNDDAIIKNLQALGLSKERAENYTMSGCNRADFPGHMSSDCYHNVAQLLLNALFDPSVETMEDLLSRYTEELENDCKKIRGHIFYDPEECVHFSLESLLLRGCPERVLDLENGGQDEPTVVHHMVGIGTAGNSLAALDWMVFKEHRLTLPEYRELLLSNYEQNPITRAYILNRIPKYGNDDDFADGWTRKACDLIADACIRMGKDSGRVHIPSYYSLHYHNNHGWKTGATPDGRLSGEPLSENMSPTYGTDKKGLIPFLESVARLPQEKAGCGGLNVRLDEKTSPEILKEITDTFFALGAINLCVDAVSRKTLLDAVAHPERHQTLCVRIAGFSEVFIRLPEYLQQEIINRTPMTAG